MKPKTKLEILQETADFYAADPKRRAVEAGDGNKCYYHLADGRQCAVGRCMLNPDIYAQFRGTVSMLKDGVGGDLDKLLKPEYRGHSLNFWAELQNFHDTWFFWTDTGLSDTGTAHLERLKKDFA